MRKFWLPILLGFFLTAILFPLGIVFGKSGELFSLIFFPFTAILAFAFPTNSGSVGVALGYASFFLQYPIYSVTLKAALDRGKFFKWLLLLLGLHALVALACFVTYWQGEH